MNFIQYCKNRKYEPKDSFIQVHKEIFALWKLWIKESAIKHYFKRLET